MDYYRQKNPYSTQHTNSFDELKILPIAIKTIFLLQELNPNYEVKHTKKSHDTNLTRTMKQINTV